MPRTEPESVSTEEVPCDPEKVLAFSVAQLHEFSTGFSLYGENRWYDLEGDGELDLYILDHPNFQAMLGGQPFDALAVVEGLGPGFEYGVHPPVYGDWYFVLVHQSRFHHEMLLDASFQVLGAPAAPPEEEPVVEEPAALTDIVPADAPAGEDLGAGAEVAADGGGSGGGRKDSGCTAGGGAGGGAGALLALLLLLAAARRRGRAC